MQVRKMIRILNEMIEKDPSVAFKKVCVDRRYTDSNHKGDMQFKEVSEIETHWCIWEPGNFEIESQRQVVVIGNY